MFGYTQSSALIFYLSNFFAKAAATMTCVFTSNHFVCLNNSPNKMDGWSHFWMIPCTWAPTPYSFCAHLQNFQPITFQEFLIAWNFLQHGTCPTLDRWTNNLPLCLLIKMLLLITNPCKLWKAAVDSACLTSLQWEHLKNICTEII